MGPFIIISLLSLGFGLAWLFDTAILQRTRKPIQLEGPTLLQLLKESKSYARIQSGEKISPRRPLPRPDHHHDHLDDSRHRGAGGEVLQLDARKKL